MLSISSFMRPGATAALALAAVAASAQTITIETGSYANSGIGSEFSSPYDNFTITGNTITLASPSAPVAVSLGQYSFEVGPNCWSCTLTPSFDGLIDVTVNGMTRQVDLPYSWWSTGPSDFLSFSTPAPVVFDFNSLGLVTIAIDSLGVVSSSGNMVYGNFGAIVSVTPVPEPASYALMLAGFGAIGFVARRRRG